MKDNITKKMIVEAALMISGKPLSTGELMALFEEDERPNKKELISILEEITDNCVEFGYELKELSSGFQFQAKIGLSPWLSRLWPEKPPRFSKALLETMSIIAYRQPITRAEIEELRGVSVSSNIMKTLLERKWVKILGQKEVLGRPSVFGTTQEFLDYFNVKSISELPTLEQLDVMTQQEILLDDNSMQESSFQNVLSELDDENNSVTH